MMRATLWSGAVLGTVLITAGLKASADDRKGGEKPALSGVWALQGYELKLEFSDKNVLTVSPHGDRALIAILCEYRAEKDGRIEARVTGFEGKDEAKEKVKELLPVGTKFSFKWKVTDDTARLEDVKGDKAEHLKSHLEGEYRQKK